MRANFNACLAVTLKHEGGYVNDPHDPGGETNLGISKRSYPKEDIHGMTRKRAAAIYRRDFWDAVNGDDLPAGLDLVAFDAAVNSGVMRGSKWVQQALGVKADGRIGPVSLAAAHRADVATVVQDAISRRFDFLRGLRTWPRYKRGWTARLEAVEAAALSMASKAPAAQTSPSTGLPRAENAIVRNPVAWLLSLIGGGLALWLATIKGQLCAVGWIAWLFATACGG